MGQNKLLLLALALFSGIASSAEPIRVVVEHSCSRPTVLSVSITNESPARVDFGKGLIPWSDASKTLRVEAFTIDNGRSKRIPGQAAISDHLGNISLLPGRTMKGEISLARILVGLDSAHKSSNIVVLITVQPMRRNGVAMFRGGSRVLVIPKSGFLTDECPTLVPQEESAK